MDEPTIVERLAERTMGLPGWRFLQDAVAARRTVHVAVMVEPYLSLILNGSKTIESRFSKNAIAPFHQISRGDLVLLKLTGGPVMGHFTTGSVEFVTLTPPEFARLQADYSEAICADEEFWKLREDKRYATLVGVSDACEVRPAPLTKSDRRGWVVVPPSRAGTPAEQLELV
jgi:hypothetical protein